MSAGLTLSQARAALLKALADAGIERSEAEREADLIVQHASGWNKARQMAQPDAVLSAPAQQVIDNIQSGRLRREPLQYLLGEQWFMGLRFAVRQGVLIPRPDTETLVELAGKFLAPLAAPVFVDIGCGSGAIAISLLHALPRGRAYAVDISQTAIAVTEENARALGVSDRLELFHGDWADFAASEKLDAVLSNPPYVPLSSLAQLQPEVAIFEPKEALLGHDEDGLGFFRALSKDAGRYLAAGGLLAVEVGADQGAAVGALFGQAGWTAVTSHHDLAGVARCISALHAVEAIGRLP